MSVHSPCRWPHLRVFVCRSLPGPIELHDERWAEALREISRVDIHAAERLVATTGAPVDDHPGTGASPSLARSLSGIDAVHREATVLMRDGLKQRRTRSSTMGVANRTPSDGLFGPKLRPQAELRRADWQRQQTTLSTPDEPSVSTPVSAGVGGAGGVLFRAIVVDVLRYSGLELCFRSCFTPNHPRTDHRVSLLPFLSCSPTRRLRVTVFCSQAQDPQEGAGPVPRHPAPLRPADDQVRRTWPRSMASVDQTRRF